MKINFPLLALSIGAFAIGTTEFSPMGMLPNIAASIGISIPTAGLLVIIYAAGVMLGAPIMTLLLIRHRPRYALLFLMAIFTVGNLLSSLSPNFTILIISRFITSLNHGAFFGIGAVVAANIVPLNKQASAIASMFMGLTIANIVGVPFITWVAQYFGWREAFFIISLIGVITMFSLLVSLPKNIMGREVDIKKELRILTQRQVLLAFLLTILGASSMFTLYTYIAPILMDISLASENTITLMLVIVGVGFSLGNYLGGKFGDISLNKTLFVLFAILASSMFVFPYAAQSQIGAGISLFIWAIASFGIVPPLQMKVMDVAKEAPALASSVNIGAFNLGNALGAMAGALVLTAGLGYAMVVIVGGLIALSGLLLFVVERIKVKSHFQSKICGNEL